MITRRLLEVVLAMIVIAGCSYDGADETAPGTSRDGGASIPRTTTSTELEAPRQRDDSTRPTNAEGRAVIDDWYDNGSLDASHDCEAVRAAIAGLPSTLPGVESAVEDLRRAARVACSAVEPASPVTPSEVRAVIEDWYLDGVFDSPHRCSAVRAAIKRLPTGGRDYFPVHEDMRLLERRTC